MDAHSVSPPPAPIRRKLLSQSEYAELGRSTTARELDRLKTTTEYLDRRDEFQQREATLEAAAARHSWIRHMYTFAQVLAVCGLLCACLCVSVIFLANSYPRVLGLPGPERITDDAPALTDSDVGTNTLSAPHAVLRLGSESAARLQQADPSTSPVSGTIAPLTAPSSVAKSVVAATGTSQAVPTTVEYAAVSERTGKQVSQAEDLSVLDAPIESGMIEIPEDAADESLVAIEPVPLARDESAASVLATQTDEPPISSGDTEPVVDGTAAAAASVQAHESARKQGDVSEHPPSLAPSAGPADIQPSEPQQVADSAVPLVQPQRAPDSSPAPETPEADTSTPTPTSTTIPEASRAEQPRLQTVFDALCPPPSGSVEGKNTPGEVAMHLGADVFWAPVAFEIFCMSASALTAAGTAAVNAAGSPTIAVAYLLLVMTMSAIACMFLQPSQHSDGVYGQLAAAVTPLAAPRQAISSTLGLPRRSPSFQRLLSDPESAVSSGSGAVMHGAIAHTPSTGGNTLQMPSPWRRDMVALQSDLNKVQHEDEDQGAAITKSLDQLMRMRSQAQSSVAAGAPTSPGSASGYASGSDAENIPNENVLHTSDSDAENVPDEIAVGRVPLDEDDTVCYGGSQGAPVSHGGSALHGEGDASDAGASEVALAPSGNGVLHRSEGPVGAHSEVVALADGSMAAANAVAALSAASDGYEAKQQALVTRLTQLEQSVTQRRARRAAQDGADCGGLSGPSGSAISPAQQQLREETDDLTCIVEDMVSQVNCTVDAARYLVPLVYGADVHVHFTGETWHTETRNLMKVAGLQLQQQHSGVSVGGSPGPSPSGARAGAPSAGLFSPAASGAGAGAHAERTGSNRGHGSPEVAVADSPQGEVARLVGQILEGGLPSRELSEAAQGISAPVAATIRQLQSHLGELTALQGDARGPPVASSKARRSPPTPLTLPPLNQQFAAATPNPTPASAATTRASPSAGAHAARTAGAGVAISSDDLLARCQEFASELGAAGASEAVQVSLQVAANGHVAVNFAVCVDSHSSAHSHRLFRSLSMGLRSREAQHAAELQSLKARSPASPLAGPQPSPLAILPAADRGSMHEDNASAFEDAHTSFLSHSAAPAWHPQGDADTAAPPAARAPQMRAGNNNPLGLAIHLDTASAAKLAQTDMQEEASAESLGETWSMATRTQLSGRDTAGTGLSQGLASNVSELYERGFQLEQSLHDIDARGCFRAGQEAEVAGRPQSASEGIRELQRILCTSAAAAASQADSGEWAFDHTLLEAAVTDAYTTAIRKWEDVTLTKDEVRTLRRYLQRTMADIMARVATPSPSVGTSTGSSTASADAGDVDTENSGHAASSGQRDKFLSYRYLVGTVNRLLSDVEEQDVRFRHVLGEAVSLQEQLAVARKGFACLESQLEARGEPPAAGGSLPGLPSRGDSDGDLPHPNSLPGAASRDMLLSQLVTWDPTAPDASAPANVLRQFQEVDRPLAPLAAQMDTDTSLSADSSLLWKKQQLDDFILGMEAHSDTVAEDLATADATMRATLAAVHAHAIDLLRFYESHSYAPPQSISVALNKAATQASLQDAGGPGDLPAAGTFSFASVGDDRLDYMMHGAHASGGGRRSPTAMWIENSALSGLDSVSTPDSPGSAPRGGGAYAHRSTQGILTDSNTSPPASTCSPAWAGLTQPRTRSPTPHSPPAVGIDVTSSPLRASVVGMQSPAAQSPLQFPSSSLPDAPTPSLTFTFGSQGRTPPQRSAMREQARGTTGTTPSGPRTASSGGPSTTFATPQGPLAFSVPPDDSAASDDSDSPRGLPSPALSPLLLSVLQQEEEQQQQQQHIFGGMQGGQDAPAAAQSSPSSSPVRDMRHVSGAISNGPTSNDSSLSFVQQSADLLAFPSALFTGGAAASEVPARAAPALPPNPFTAAAPKNTTNAAPVAQWPLAPAVSPPSAPGASAISAMPKGLTTTTLQGSATRPAKQAASPAAASSKLPFVFGASSTTTSPCQPGDAAAGATQARKSLSAGDGSVPGSKLPRRPSHTGSGARSSRASSVEGEAHAADTDHQHTQPPQQPAAQLPPTTGDASVPLAPLAMQGSVRPAGSEASSMVLPTGSGISLSAGVAAVAAVSTVPPPLALPDDLQAAAAAEDDAMLPEEEAQGIEETFPGLSPPIVSPTEPTVAPQRAKRSVQASNPLRVAIDFSDAGPRPAALASEPTTSGAASPPVPPPRQASASAVASEHSSPVALSGGVSDLSLPRVGTPGASTPPPRGSAHRTHERPWDNVHTHDNALFSDRSPSADGAGASGGGSSVRASQLTVTQMSAQKLPEGCDADVERRDARMPSPDENSSENLPVRDK